ncbi:hypothetical protein J1605_001876 [Eschrichtius robustus]|uniref:Clavesin-1 n=1 Tax=Eschrichtius robustus TaxID=9764 RepID=A0AB34HW74_ESCRO|nr:hypothetical protein J1605_001876 [Eschrichtius robustus]
MGTWARTLLGPDYSDENDYTHTSYNAMHVRHTSSNLERECSPKPMKRQQQDGQRQPGASSDASKEGPLLLLGCACRQMPHKQSSVMNEKVTGTEQSPFRAAFDP